VKHFPRLANLIILRLSAAWLQVDRFAYPGFAEEMVAPRDPHFKSEMLKQLTKFSETPRSIALRISQPIQ